MGFAFGLCEDPVCRRFGTVTTSKLPPFWLARGVFHPFIMPDTEYGNMPVPPEEVRMVEAIKGIQPFTGDDAKRLTDHLKNAKVDPKRREETLRADREATLRVKQLPPRS